MDYQVDFRDSFIEDLKSIVTSIAAKNSEAARKLGDSIVAAGERLEFFPHRHPRVSHRPSLRRFVVAQHYKVFYRIREDAKIVEIIRCWDGRRGTDPV